MFPPCPGTEQGAENPCKALWLFCPITFAIGSFRSYSYLHAKPQALPRRQCPPTMPGSVVLQGGQDMPAPLTFLYLVPASLYSLLSVLPRACESGMPRPYL